MQRDIEFRAWDNENEYMIYSKQGVYTALRSVMNIVRQDDGYYNNGDLLMPNKEKYTLMQYSGLKDKNGTKIFEGDIIQLDDDYRKLISSCNAKNEEDLVRKNCLVGYKDGAFMFCRNRYIIDNFDSYLWLAVNYCKVIGNIYENRDLLD